MSQRGTARARALRLMPGDDVRATLEAYAREIPVPAAGVVSAVGSLAHAVLRMAGADIVRNLSGPFEVLTLSGTLGATGAHLHMSMSDSSGHCVGGHICRGCVVHTTLELVLLELDGVSFGREFDARTGYPELVINRTDDRTAGPSDV